ncbi:MAG TPA: hypothetical protein VK162_02005 [Streptosporangiaceae bacterium]|nr:hypothetical protein [Streptosporangiaceae bacterium]
MDDLVESVKAKLRPQYDAKAQSIVRRVNAEMAGMPVEEILATLRARMREAGFQPLDEGLRPAAEAISDRSLT